MSDAPILAALDGVLHVSDAFGTTPAAALLIVLALLAIVLVAGVIDGVAGGGGLLTIPSLMMTGLPPQTVLGTNKILASMGTTVALARFARGHLVLWRVAALGIPFTLAGAWAGARLILWLPQELLGRLLIALLPIGIFLTLFSRKKESATRALSQRAERLLIPPVCFAIGMYDGFFGPGTGSFLILAFHFILRMDYTRASATTKTFNLASNLAALAVFLLNGRALIPLGILLGTASMAGNYCGSFLAMRDGQRLIRRFLIFVLLLLFASLIYKYWLT